MNQPERRRMKLSELEPAPYNPRRISRRALERLRASLDRFGLVQDVVWNARTRTVVGGHQRLRILAESGVEEIDVVVVDLDLVDEKALNVTLNNPGIGGEFTDELEPLLLELRGELDLEFTELGLDLLERPSRTSAPAPEPRIAKGTPESTRGSVYQLGRHLLACEDARTFRFPQRSTVILTDPPYNVAAPGLRIAGDDVSSDESVELHRELARAGELEDDAVAILFHSPRLFPVALDAFREAGWRFSRMLWMHEHGARAHPWRGWLMTGDAILVLERGKGAWPKAIDPTTLDTYTHHVAGASTEKETVHGAEALDDWLYHPTLKALWIVEDLLRHTLGEVLDPCAGSGTTVIAAERLGRTARAIELDPRFVDVIRRRWAELVHGPEVDWLEATPAI